MSKKILFLVHGMGRHPAATWADSWKESILENLQQYAPYSGMTTEKIEEEITFVPIGYDGIFEGEYRQNWNDLATALADTALPSGMGRVLEALQSEGAEGGEKVFWDYLLDPLLWYSSIHARERVIASVAKQLGKGAKEAIAAGGELHILAHSLGTSVIHDTLLAMTDSSLTEGVFDYEQSGLRWDSLTQVANVSRVLSASRSPSAHLSHHDYKPHQSRVRPGSGGLVRRFLNVRHQADPFTYPRSFKPGWSHSGYSEVTVTRFDSPKGVHDLETAFDCPMVHVPCLREITGKRNLGSSQAELEQSWGRYDSLYGRDVSAPLESLRAELAPNTDLKLGVNDLAAYLRKAAREVFA